MAHLFQISVAPQGGVPKRAVAGTTVSSDGVAGDRQRDLRFHGGPERAVCLFSKEKIDALVAEGHPIAPGTTGENLTLEGLDWDRVAPGDRLSFPSGVVLEVTSFTVPCRNIRHSFRDGDFTRLSQKLHPGWSRVYARVLTPGPLHTGDVVQHTPAEQAPGAQRSLF